MPPRLTEFVTTLETRMDARAAARPDPGGGRSSASIVPSTRAPSTTCSASKSISPRFCRRTP